MRPPNPSLEPLDAGGAIRQTALPAAATGWISFTREGIFLGSGPVRTASISLEVQESTRERRGTDNEARQRLHIDPTESRRYRESLALFSQTDAATVRKCASSLEHVTQWKSATSFGDRAVRVAKAERTELSDDSFVRTSSGHCSITCSRWCAIAS